MATAMVPSHLMWSTLSASDLDGKLFYFAKVTTGNLIDIAGEDDAVIGVITETTKGSGLPVSVQVGGVAKVKLGAVLSPGVRVDCDGSGLAVAVTSNEPGVGVLLTGGSTNEIVSVLLHAG